MIFGSENIKQRAEKFRKHLSEVEALTAEGMCRGDSAEKIAKDAGVPEFDILVATRDLKVTAFFWMLVALCNTKTGEVYREGVDQLTEAAKNHQKIIGLMSCSEVLH